MDSKNIIKRILYYMNPRQIAPKMVKLWLFWILFWIATSNRLSPLCFLPFLLAVFRGTNSLCPAKALGKITQGGETQDLGDEGERMVGLPQQEPALLHPAGNKVVNRGGAELPAEGVG